MIRVLFNIRKVARLLRDLHAFTDTDQIFEFANRAQEILGIPDEKK